MICYRFKGGEMKLCSSDCFGEASREELRVLLALIESGLLIEDEEALASLAKTSRSRVVSALALFESEGVIEKVSSPESVIRYEFEPNGYESGIEEVSAKQVARDIRDNDLSSMISACEELMNRSSLPTADVKRLTALNTQHALDGEFIVMLASYLNEKNQLTVTRLVSRALKLIERGIDTVALLEDYLREMTEEDKGAKAMRSLFGIYDRTLSPAEKNYFRRWTVELAFPYDVIEYAYSISTENTASGKSYSYINSILLNWHKADCKTVAEVKIYEEKQRAERKKNAPEKAKRQSREKENTSNIPKYGNFDINDALAAALERSYGKREGGDK